MKIEEASKIYENCLYVEWEGGDDFACDNSESEYYDSSVSEFFTCEDWRPI